jgi:hypothetical protein
MRLRTTVTLAILSSIGLMGCGADDGSASSATTPQQGNAQLSAANGSPAVSPAIDTNAPANAGANAAANANAGAGANATSLAAAQPDTFPSEPPPVAPVVHYPPESSTN